MGADFNSFLTGTGNTHVADLEHSIDQSLLDGDVSHMVVEDFGGALAEESGAVDGSFVRDSDAFAKVLEPHEEGNDTECEDGPERV